MDGQFEGRAGVAMDGGMVCFLAGGEVGGINGGVGEWVDGWMEKRMYG